MQNIDSRAFRPEICTGMSSVTIPTIRVVPKLRDEGKEVVVQWFGRSEALGWMVQSFGDEASKVFEAAQFHFPVHVAVDNIRWMGEPEEFQVIFIGQLKDWPNEEAISHFKLPPETWMLYITATHYTVRQPDGNTGPPMFAIPLTIMLVDRVYGVITPKPYQDLAVAEGAARQVQL